MIYEGKRERDALHFEDVLELSSHGHDLMVRRVVLIAVGEDQAHVYGELGGRRILAS
jgi:hypothetical protein